MFPMQKCPRVCWLRLYGWEVSHRRWKVVQLSSQWMPASTKKYSREKDESVNTGRLEKKADAVIIAGTTGEGSTLSDEEHIALVEYAVKIVHGRIPVIAGAGSNNTAHAIYMSKQCEKVGADGLLHVTPYYNKTSQQGLFLHFKACAEATSLPIILYNVPSRTGVNIFPGYL